MAAGPQFSTTFGHTRLLVDTNVAYAGLGLTGSKVPKYVTHCTAGLLLTFRGTKGGGRSAQDVLKAFCAKMDEDMGMPPMDGQPFLKWPYGKVVLPGGAQLYLAPKPAAPVYLLSVNASPLSEVVYKEMPFDAHTGFPDMVVKSFLETDQLISAAVFESLESHARATLGLCMWNLRIHVYQVALGRNNLLQFKRLKSAEVGPEELVACVQAARHMRGHHDHRTDEELMKSVLRRNSQTYGPQVQIVAQNFHMSPVRASAQVAGDRDLDDQEEEYDDDPEEDSEHDSDHDSDEETEFLQGGETKPLERTSVSFFGVTWNVLAPHPAAPINDSMVPGVGTSVDAINTNRKVLKQELDRRSHEDLKGHFQYISDAFLALHNDGSADVRAKRMGVIVFGTEVNVMLKILRSTDSAAPTEGPAHKTGA